MAEHPLTDEESRVRQEIEQLLDCFYHPNTSNTEKKKIESNLNHLRTTTFTWQYCLDNLNTFNNQYLWFFASSTLEAMVYKWDSLSVDEKQYFRFGLITLLSNYPSDTPSLQRDKVAQILALVASLQVPTDYREYIEHVLLLLKEKFPNGLALARALGDTMTQDKHIWCYEQQVRFKAYILSYIPDLLRAVEPFCKYYLSSISPPDRQPPDSLDQWTIELLQMLQQYFSWIELAHLEPSLVQTILQLGVVRNEEVEKMDVAISAVSALTELYYRQQPLCHPTAVQMVSGVMTLLRQPNLQEVDELYLEKLSDLVRLCLERELQAKHVQSWDEFFNLSYKFTFEARSPQAFVERLGTWQMLLHRHADSLANSVNHPAPNLVPESLALKVAIATLERMLCQSDAHSLLEHLGDDEVDDNLETEIQQYYSRCTEVVEVTAEIVPERMYEMVVSPLLTNAASPFGQVLHILKTICATPVDGLAELCNETNERQLRVKFRDFVPVGQVLGRLCIVLYGKVSAMEETIRWLQQELAEVFAMLSVDCVQPVDLLYIRMPPGLYREMMSVTAQMITTLKTLLQQLESVGVPASNGGLTDGQMLRVLSGVMKYLAPPAHVNQAQWGLLAGAAASFLLHVSTNKLVNGRILYELLHGTLTTTRLAHLDYKTAHMVRKAICQCLMSLWFGCVNSRSSVQYINLPGSSSLSSALAMMSTATGFAAQRRELLYNYIRFLAQDLLSVEISEVLMVPTDDGQRQYRIISALTVELAQLTDLLTHFRHADSAAKGMLMNAFHGIIDRALSIYDGTQDEEPVVGFVGGVETSDRSPRHGALINAVLEFCHAAIESLQVQLGEAFLQYIIQLFLRRARAETMSKQQLRALEALLGIFVLIVEQPGNQSLIADIVQLCVDDVLLIAFSDEYRSKPDCWRHGELCVALFRLFHALLLHRWKYFVKPQLLQQQQPPQQQQQQSAAAVASERHYTAILHGYWLMITNMRDGQLVLTVLESLQTLHERCKLFREPIFVKIFLGSFLQAMLTLLLSETGDVFHELLVGLLFELACVDPMKCTVIVGNFSPAIIAIKLFNCTDLPTFTQRIKQFICDARLSTSAALLPTAAGTSSGF